MARCSTIVLGILFLVFAGPVAADERPLDGEWVEFHGWQPDSRAYAYTLVRLKSRRDRTRRTEKARLVTIDDKGRAHRKEKRGPLAPWAEEHGFVAAPLSSDRPDGNSIRFLLDDGREIWFRLVLGDRLGYAVSLRVDGASVGVGMGRFDDLYARFDAFAFLSPDGRYVAFVIYGQSPYKVRGEVHFMPLPEGPLPVPAVPAGAPVVE